MITKDAFITYGATFFKSGLAPKAPGTCGTLAALGLGIPLRYLLSFDAFLILTFILTVAGFVFSELYQKRVGTEDPQEVVIDEAAGMWITLLFTTNIYLMLLGFVLFRFFDIVKPYPIKQSQDLGGGLGIMIDDILAGIAAGLCVWFASFIIY